MSLKLFPGTSMSQIQPSNYVKPGVGEVFVLCEKKDDRDVSSFCDSLRRDMLIVGGMTITAFNKMFITITDLKDRLKEISVKKGDKIVIIISDDNKIYDMAVLLKVKMSLNVHYMKASTLRKSYNEKVRDTTLDKINMALGGTKFLMDKWPWLDNEVLIFSYDLSSPTGDDMAQFKHIAPSCVGTSHNGGARREDFLTSFHYQPKSEIVCDRILELQFKQALDDFVTTRGNMPNKVLIVRDGIGISQYYQVFDEEFQTIKRSCSQYAKNQKINNYKPAFALILCCKRVEQHVPELVPKNQVFDKWIKSVSFRDQENVEHKVYDIYLKHGIPTSNHVKYALLHSDLEDLHIAEQFRAMILQLVKCRQERGDIKIPNCVHLADKIALLGLKLIKNTLEQGEQLPTTSTTSGRMEYDYVAMRNLFSNNE